MAMPEKPFASFDKNGDSGLWDTSKLTSVGDAELIMVGGSNVDSGHGYFDTFGNVTTDAQLFSTPNDGQNRDLIK